METQSPPFLSMREPTFREVKEWARITWRSGREESKPSPILLKHPWAFHSVPLHLIIHWNFKSSFSAPPMFSFTPPKPSRFPAIWLLISGWVWKGLCTFSLFVSRVNEQFVEQEVPLERERMKGGHADLLREVNRILQSSESPQWEGTVHILY